MVKRDATELRTDPADGLPGLAVGAWAQDKHKLVERYVDITSATRAKFLGPGKAGATFVDLFCSYGRSYIRETNTWIDGSALVAWKTSVGGGSPFSSVYLADTDASARKACTERLRSLGATSIELDGDAIAAADQLIGHLDPYALHTVFLDPYGLGPLDFEIFRLLSRLRRVDLMIHISTMDFQRNLSSYMSATRSELDNFAPGWREVIRPGGDPSRTRAEILEYWKTLIEKLGVWPATEMKQIKGPGSQRLYWIALASKHPLGHKFWKIASNPEKQGNLFDNY